MFNFNFQLLLLLPAFTVIGYPFYNKACDVWEWSVVEVCVSVCVSRSLSLSLQSV